MKFLRFICNFLLFLACTFVVSSIQVGGYDLVAVQSSNVEAVHIVAQKEEQVGYIDTYTFWAEDIGTGVKEAGPKYRIRSWFDADWWKNGMKWADVALDSVIAVVKPIVVPVAQINAVMNYHGVGINEANIEKVIVASYNGDTEEARIEKANLELYRVYEYARLEEVQVIWAYNADGGAEYKALAEVGGVRAIGYHELTIEEWFNTVYSGERELVTKIDSEIPYAKWVARNKVMYNQFWKLHKYSNSGYQKYYRKFIKADDVEYTPGYKAVDHRNIKTAATVLYYQQLVSVIIALIFVIKYPITFVQYRVEDGGQARRHLFGRKHRKDDK